MRRLFLLAVNVPLCFSIATRQPSAQAARGQTEHRSARPRFDAVTIRPTMGGMEGFLPYLSGRLRCIYCTIDRLIQIAYDVQPFQIAGEPDGYRQEGYDIIAVLPSSSETNEVIPSERCPPLSGEQKLMIQTLLSERFHLNFHHESRDIPEYVLTKGSELAKLQASKIGASRPRVWFSLDLLKGSNASMTLLAARLTEFLKRPVIDETGLQGPFDFKYESSGSSSGYSDEGVATIVTTAVERIGLELQLSNGPVDTIVVDHVEMPSDN